MLSSAHIAQLFFPTADRSVSSLCRSRLRVLVLAGYLQQAEQLQTKSDGRRPYLYFLTAAGRNLLTRELGYEPEELDWKPSYNDVTWPFLDHQLAINDVFLAVSRAAEAMSWRVEQWIDDRFLRKAHTTTVEVVGDGGRVERVAVVPDAYFVLARGEVLLHFFLELDRGTMALSSESRLKRSWKRRIAAYQAYFASPAIVEGYSTNRIRVLTVSSGGEGRVRHLCEATEEVGGMKRYWFTRCDALAATLTLTEAIWHVAQDPGLHPLLPRP